MAETKIKLELTEEEAELFKQFQKHYRFLKFLEDAGAFEMKSAHVTIHLTNLGEIGTFDLIEKFSHFKIPLPV